MSFGLLRGLAGLTTKKISHGASQYAGASATTTSIANSNATINQRSVASAKNVNTIDANTLNNQNSVTTNITNASANAANNYGQTAPTSIVTMGTNTDSVNGANTPASYSMQQVV